MLLVVGANGFVGENVVRFFRATGRPVCSASHRAGADVFLDLAQERPGLEGLDAFPLTDALLCSGITDIDRCRSEADAAWAFNVTRTTRLVTLLQARGIRIIYCSSDLVFAGDRGDYLEHEETLPSTAYGRQKRAVETFLADQACPHAVIRMSKLYSLDACAGSMIHRVISALRSSANTRFATDQVVAPTCVEDVARTVAAILDRKLDGRYHVAPQRHSSWYDLALTVGVALGAADRVVPCLRADFDRLEARPPRLYLNGTHSTARTGVRPLELHEVLDRIIADGCAISAENAA